MTFILLEALKLEEEGILGEGMTFSDEEKRKAAETPAVHNTHVYGNVHGVVGNVSGQNIQIGGYGDIHQQLKDAGIGQPERNELENIMDELKKAKPEDKPSLRQRGMDWLGRNASNLGLMGSAAIKAYIAAHSA